MIALYDKNTNKKLALLDDIIIEDSIRITRKINGEFSLKFETVEANLKSEYFQSDVYIMVDGYYFDIAYVEQLHSDILTYLVECEHVSYRLIKDEVPYYTFDGTPYAILTDILAGTEFQPGQVEQTEVLTFAVYEETNKLGLVQLLANTINAEIGYEGFMIELKNTVGKDRGFVARFGKNIIGVKKIIDKRNGLTYYSVDIVELKNHPDYSGYADLEIIEEGDSIRIVDEVIGLDIINKVIKRTYNPINAINTSLEIANSIELLTDTVTKIQRETVIKEKLYHGIRISPELGFESIRNDKMARGIFNSDTIAFQTGDGAGSWTNQLYYDSNLATFVFDGSLSANVLISPNLYAGKANIAELTVDRLETGDKVAKYLSSDTADLNFIRIQDQYIDFVTATTNGLYTQQAEDRDGNALYWLDESHQAATIEPGPLSVLIYQYTEVVKQKLFFEVDGGTGYYVPKFQFGGGDGVKPYSATGEIVKGQTGLWFKYYKSNTGELVQIGLTDDGIVLTDGVSLTALTFYTNGFSASYGSHLMAFRWTKNGLGQITNLQNVDTSVNIPITWDGGTL